ncbi:hypothetical protein M153_20400013279 [Pseudoloma neurophilia]|uniref:Transposable element n=1 Tax=Pseudoloma neurophilia TaxID=146866 RepID=A0A0R0LZQ9_9MICR|nr:hypothetical protein M153_20400013279 [Pseudoloma neurophilia]
MQQPCSMLPLVTEMASTTNLNIKSYNGTDSEDIILWLKEMTMCQQIFGWDELTEKRMIIVHLKGDARAWMAEFLNEKDYEISTQVLKTELQRDFYQRAGQMSHCQASSMHGHQKIEKNLKPFYESLQSLHQKE